MVIVLSTALLRRGTKWQLALAVSAIVTAALLLGPAQFWYTLRFTSKQATLSLLEIRLMLAYVILCGWLAPLSTTAIYLLFATTRTKAGQRGDSPGGSKAPASRRRTGEPAPFVYSADKPWGWLVYKNGKFTGQELALKHAIISLGREEDNEVWLDDETISRYHAELVWEKGKVSITDNGSLNGVLLNGKRIHSSQPLKPGDELGIGEHRFLFKYAQQQAQDDLSDPLLPQLRRLALNKNTSGKAMPGYKLPAKPTVALDHQHKEPLPTPQISPSPAEQDRDISSLATMKLGVDKVQQQNTTLADIKTTPLPPVSPVPEAPPPLNLPPFPLRLPSKPPKEPKQNPSP